MRVGFGTDLHRLSAGRPLVLGGVRVPHDRGPMGHSDGDVVLHALTDALLGAIGQGDIGRLFPDTDPAYAGVASDGFVAEALARARRAGYRVGNADIVIQLERPKIEPHRDDIRRRVAMILGVGEDRVNVKAKTNEGTGAIGRGEALACQVVVLLEVDGPVTGDCDERE